MSGRIAPWLAWSLAGVSLILCVAAILLYIPTLSVQTPTSWGTGAVIVFLTVLGPGPIAGLGGCATRSD
jgi:hypothetical protein